MSIIDLSNDCIYKNCFWKTTKNLFTEFINGKYQFKILQSYFKIEMEKDDNNIKCFLYSHNNTEECMIFTIKNNNTLHLDNLYKACKFENITDSNTRTTLNLLDSLAIAFGVSSIFLQDAAVPYKFKKGVNSIDYTLLTVMKENKTFYEKYGYSFCEPKNEYIKTIDIEIHKKLLREFDFGIFKLLLNKYDLEFITILESVYRKKYKYLYEFYNDTMDYCNKKFDKFFIIDEERSDKYYNMIFDLQNILTNDNYPWFSMINIIQSSKFCMEKLILDPYKIQIEKLD